MGIIDESRQHWSSYKFNLIETIFASLFFLVFIIGIIFFIFTLRNNYLEGEWTYNQYVVIFSICIFSLLLINYVFISTLYNHVSSWRSLKNMYYLQINTPSEKINTKITKKLLTKDVRIERCDMNKWNKQLYLVYSYLISYKNQSSYLLIGDTTDEGEEPNVKIYIGPFTDKNEELCVILKSSI